MNVKMALLPNAMNYSGSMGTGVSPLNGDTSGGSMDNFLSNLLQAIGGQDSPPYGDLIPSNILEDLALSESPPTSSSTGSLSCSKCDDRPSSGRCLDCREAYPPAPSPQTYQCEAHSEPVRYYCQSCASIVCQECTLWEHKDHVSVPIQDAIQASKAKVQKSFENALTGTNYYKHRIDRAVAISRTVEREAGQVSMKIRKAMRHFTLAIEERERQLLEKVAKMRQLKLNELTDQMHGLRNGLAGLAQTKEYLRKVLDSEGVEMLMAKDKADAKIELYANMYKSLEPKDEGFLFVSPNFEQVLEMKKQGDVVSVANKVNVANNNGSTVNPLSSPVASGFGDIQRAVKRPGPVGPAISKSFIPPAPCAAGGAGHSVTAADKNIRKGTGQCIPGCTTRVVAKQSRSPLPSLPTISFGADGPEDGQVSRPWGLCVDKEGNIIVADRRNNRIQIFSPEGLFKLKFGTKGTAPGEFDLPAGITTDIQGRIVVVDKDNHRVQIFTPIGGFFLTFGSYGKGCGQFRYPWDVAINSEGQMVITDSRNYRIQLFNSEGIFITMLMFDGINHGRMLKGLTTPRGVCFTPRGEIIISDFENHRLLLIDSTLTSILSAKGCEGLAIGDFSRPSGIICDDEGRIIVADSKNQRVIVFSPFLEFLWALEVRGTGPEGNDRPTDVGLTPQGRLVVIVEGLPDARDSNSPGKKYIQIF